MLDKILPWIGGIFAGVGVMLIFFDVIATIKRRNKTKTNIAGLVILSIAVVGYVITDLILPAVKEENGWPAIASLLWIVLFWVYVILDAIVTWGDIKIARRKKKELRASTAATVVETSSDKDAANKDESVENEENGR